MPENARATVVAAFDDRRHARLAVEELYRSGFTAEQVGFIIPEGDPKVEVHPQEGGTKAEEGAAAGAATGTTLGGLVGAALASSLIPGVGPVIAGGLLAGLVVGAAAGLAGGGLVGTLIGLSIPEEEARGYEKEFQSGRTLVTVRAEGRCAEAEAILRRVAEGEEGVKLHPGDRAARVSDTYGPSPGTGSVFPGT